jgi:hypothetical protein
LAYALKLSKFKRPHALSNCLWPGIISGNLDMLSMMYYYKNGGLIRSLLKDFICYGVMVVVADMFGVY